MHTGKKTKIIATIGPSSQSEDTIKKLILEGVNIFRFNTKHNTNDWHVDNIKLVHKVSEELKIPVGILIDLQGPEIRIETYNGEEVPLNKGDQVVFTTDFAVSLPDLFNPVARIRIPQQEVFEALKAKDRFSIDDGFIDFEVVNANHDYFLAHIKEDAVIKNRKGLNLVEVDVDLPSLTKADIDRIEIMSHVPVDFIALSFARSKDDIERLRAEMAKSSFAAKVIAKIESHKGVENIDEIIDSADGVMVARGDLGIEVPIERVTHIQKTIIRKCRDKNKPVIVATQMLQSMVDNARPTRAEAADIANAVYDETDCLMLSNETASGKYPLKSVETMRKIAVYNELHKVVNPHRPPLKEQTHLIVNAAISIVDEGSYHNDLKIDKIVVLTETGATARVFSSFRPKVPVVAISGKEDVVRSMSINYGVMGLNVDIEQVDLLYPENVIKYLKNRDLIKPEETLLIVHGHKFKQPGSTNALVVVKVN